jgi:hypothetical protein
MLMRVLAGCLALPAAVLVAASNGPSSATVENKASGVGSIVFHKEAVAMFDFNVSADPVPRGAMLCAAEHHEEYPETIITIDDIKRATFTEHSVYFTGRGTMGENPVTIKVSALDGVGSGYPDHFAIVVVNISGSVVFEAEGDLIQGDIYVGQPQ